MLETVGCWDAAGDGNNYDKAKGKKKYKHTSKTPFVGFQRKFKTAVDIITTRLT